MMMDFVLFFSMYGASKSTLPNCTDIYADTPEVLTPCSNFSFDEYESIGCPAIVLFYSYWCNHCRTIAPQFKKYAIETSTINADGIHVFAIDCMKNLEVCSKSNITTVPILKFFDGETWCDVTPFLANLTKVDWTTSTISKSVDRNRCLSHRVKEIFHQSKRLKEEFESPKRGLILQDYSFNDAFWYALKYEVPPFISSKCCSAEDESFETNFSYDFKSRRTDPRFQHKIYCTFRRHVLDTIPYIVNRKEVKRDNVLINHDKLCSYTCGLWKLFHRLLQNPGAVRSLQIVQSYILTFFRCRVCQDHFSEMCEHSLNNTSVFSDESARLWLWKAHNKVNERIGNPIWPLQAGGVSCDDATVVLRILDEQYGSIRGQTIRQSLKSSMSAFMNSFHGNVVLSDLFPIFFTERRREE